MHKNRGAPIQPKSIRYSLYSLLAVLVAMIFLFPIYWAFSTSLRNPIDTFTVSGLGIPFIHFEPTLDNWIDQLYTFLKVALPLAAPAIVATGLIMFAFTWNEFLFAVTISSKDVITIPIHMAGAVDTRGVQFWFMAVRAMIAIAPPVIIALLAQKYIVQGLTLGAVKG